MTTEKRKAQMRARTARYRRLHPIRCRIEMIGQRARGNGGTVSFKYLLSIWTPTCPVFNTPWTVCSTPGGDNFSMTLDRLDPEKGYVEGNVCFVSSLANRIKSNASSAQVEEVALWMKRKGL